MSVNVGIKNWDISVPDEALVDELCKALMVPRPVAALLPPRGVNSVEMAREYLFPEESGKYPYDPFLFEGMNVAANCLIDAMKAGKKVCIFGDYDVDGITSVSVFCRYFRSIGFENFSYYIPDRLTEGYGMNMEAVELLAAAGVDLVITVDNGVSAKEEIKRAYELGVKVIVTDHHECRLELPDCVAVINPKRENCGYPFEHLAGVATAYKLVCACEILRTGSIETLPHELEQLVAIGTVADMMPIVGENRYIVKKGLESIRKNPLVGIYQLAKAQYSEKNQNDDDFKLPVIDSTFVSFSIAPRINAAGRIGKTKDAVVLLTTDDTYEAYENAHTLCALNSKRQSIETEIFEQACALIEREHDFKNHKVIVVAGEGWNHGVIGIVASRVTGKYKLPCILICLEGDAGKGSARSIEGFNINGAISFCKNLLVRFGGHELAAGLTLLKENIPEFREMINSYAKELITEEMRKGTTHIDLVLSPDEVNENTVRAISMLEPFGNGNVAPLYCLENAQISSIIPIGSNKHLKLTLSKDGAFFTALLFGTPLNEFRLKVGAYADFSFNPDINEYCGRKSVQLIVRDCRLCERDAQNIKRIIKECKNVLDGKSAPKASEIPTIDEMRRFFVYLKGALQHYSPGDCFWFLALDFATASGEDANTTLAKCIFMMSIFDEMGLVDFELNENASFTAEMNKFVSKVDMENSCVFKALKGEIN